MITVHKGETCESWPDRTDWHGLDNRPTLEVDQFCGKFSPAAGH